MGFHCVEEISERLKKVVKKWSLDILHGHGTVEECADELLDIAKEIDNL